MLAFRGLNETQVSESSLAPVDSWVTKAISLSPGRGKRQWGYLLLPSRTDNYLGRKYIQCFRIDYLKKKPKRPNSLASLVIRCTAGFACFIVSIPSGPGQPKRLFSIITSLFTLGVNSFTGSWSKKQPSQPVETQTSLLPAHLTEGKAAYKFPWLLHELERVQAQAKLTVPFGKKI